MDLRNRLAEALGKIPSELLDATTQEMVAEARTSLEAAAAVDDVPTAVAFVGRSGSGKSTIVNALTGLEVSPVGPIRPTTTMAIMVGASGPVSLSSESEYVHVEGARQGFVLIDTPSWDHDPGAVMAAMAAASVVVLVVTPARYADLAVSELRDQVPNGVTTFVVLNRMTAEEDGRDELLASVRGIHGDVLVVEAGRDHSMLWDAIDEAAPRDRSAAQRRRVLDRAAAATARVVAERVTRQATEVGRVESAVAGFGRVVPPPVAVLENWDDTRSNVVSALRGVVAAVDGALVDAGGELGRRIFEGLTPITTAEVGSDVDAWGSSVEDRVAAAVRTWWRPKAARTVARRFAPRIGIDPNVPLPARLVRALGDRLASVREEAHASFLALVSSTADRRVGMWEESVSSLGAYTPGELLEAADAVG